MMSLGSMNVFLKGSVWLFVILVSATSAQAHNRSQSFSTWNVGEREVTLSVTVLSREVTRLVKEDRGLSNLDQVLASHIVWSTGVTSNHSDCTVTGPVTHLKTRQGFLGVEIRFQCEDAPIKLVFNSFFDVARAHTNFAKVRGNRIDDMLFTSSRRSYDLQQVQREGAATFWSVVSRYIALGIAHISTGYDHLAFLLALLLLSLGRREIILSSVVSPSDIQSR